MEQDIQNRTRRAAAGRVAIAIKRVFTDIKVERRQFDSGESKQRLEHALEVIFGVACAHLLVQIGQTVQNPAL